MKETCPKCHGQGTLTKTVKCGICNGMGKVCKWCKTRGVGCRTCKSKVPMGICKTCKGTGKVHERCHLCSSAGWIRRKDEHKKPTYRRRRS